ncbi:PssD/Cps14F family polysaccharide biosynthesis glycosyltransferase [Jeotgalibacillus proteolyticus]|uniref:PssD/Cps14F family polysaccharide biosynthesis glycosyltransferase n=1 Tax=Jeotgalibacillus proteolyticus TaxID=2082395 RepID=UPI003CE8E162
MKICFAASSGGHFEQLMMLKNIMQVNESFILTEKTNYSSDSDQIKTYYVTQINRKEILLLPKIFINFIKVFYIFVKEKPEVFISTGALSVIPLMLIMKLFKRKVIFIESFSKIETPTLTGKLAYKISDIFVVQWEEMLKVYPKAVYGGSIY